MEITNQEQIDVKKTVEIKEVEKTVETKKVEKICQNKYCFIITPIGEANTDIRRQIEGVIDSVIEPIVENMGYKVRVAHKEYGQGLITENVINSVCDSELVIANLTGLNPNVMFEVALRYCTDKPIIHICEKGTPLPFDIKDQRTIFYTNDMFGVSELKEQLQLMIEEIDFNEKNKNIITSTRKKKVLIDSIAESGEKLEFNILIKELESIKKVVSNHSYEEKKIINIDKKHYEWVLRYFGNDDLYDSCDLFVNYLKKIAVINSVSTSELFNTLNIGFSTEPMRIIEIKKTMKSYKLIEESDDIPF